MKALLKRLFFSFCVTLLSSCNSDSGPSGGGGVATNFAITGSGMNATVSTSSNWFFPSAYALTPPPLLDSNLANVDLLEAWIVVKNIHFFRPSDPAVQSSAGDNYKGPFFVDLLDGTPEQFGQIVLHSDGLRRVKMLLHKSNSLPAGVPVELSGNSMYFKGTVNGHTFTYTSDDTTVFDVYGDRAVYPQDGEKLMVTFRIANLFKKIDLSAINMDMDISATNRVSATNPCPLIHASALNLYTCFRQGMNKEAKFGVDDGDDDLSDSETVN